MYTFPAEVSKWFWLCNSIIPQFSVDRGACLIVSWKILWRPCEPGDQLQLVYWNLKTHKWWTAEYNQTWHLTQSCMPWVLTRWHVSKLVFISGKLRCFLWTCLIRWKPPDAPSQSVPTSTPSLGFVSVVFECATAFGHLYTTNATEWPRKRPFLCSGSNLHSICCFFLFPCLLRKKKKWLELHAVLNVS